MGFLPRAGSRLQPRMVEIVTYVPGPSLQPRRELRPKEHLLLLRRPFPSQADLADVGLPASTQRIFSPFSQEPFHLFRGRLRYQCW